MRCSISHSILTLLFKSSMDLTKARELKLAPLDLTLERCNRSLERPTLLDAVPRLGDAQTRATSGRVRARNTLAVKMIVFDQLDCKVVIGAEHPIRTISLAE